MTLRLNGTVTGTADNLRVWSREAAASQVPQLILTYSPPGDTVAPSAPSGVSTQVTGSSVAVSWSESSDNVEVTGYSVYRGTTAGFTPDTTNRVAQGLSGLSYADTNVPRGDYFYKVVARDAASNSSSASDPAAVTVPDYTAPSVPSNLAATVTGDSVALSWSAATDDVAVTGYSVFRGTTAGFDADASSRIAQDLSTLSYTDSGRPAGTWFYKVRARDAAGNVSDASAAAQATIVPSDTTAPSVPSNVTSSVSGGSVTVGWSASSDNVGVTGYQVFRGTTAGFTPGAGNRIADDVAGLSYTDTGRPLGTFFYKVKAKDAAGNLSAASAGTSATVAASTVTVATTDDGMAYQSQPNTNFGTQNQVAAYGGSTPVQGFFKFVLPAAPPGTCLLYTSPSPRD